MPNVSSSFQTCPFGCNIGLNLGIVSEIPPCMVSFSSNETIALHMKNVHSGKIYQCNNCDKVFRAKGNLIRHFKITHSTKEEIIKIE